eukprot:gene25727-11385_t
MADIDPEHYMGHYAGNNELLHLRSSLNEKELELIELREQHVQLVEARSNWEAALASKDRAILQLEEALASRQRSIEELVAATANIELEGELDERNAQVASLERVLGEAKSKISSLKQTAQEQQRQLEMAHAQLLSRSEDDRRVDLLQQQLTSAFKEELQGEHERSSEFQSAATQLSGEVNELRRQLVLREERIQYTEDRQQEQKHQIEELRHQVAEERARGAAVADSSAAAKYEQHLAELQKQLLSITLALNHKEGQAKKYKDATRALKARLVHSDAKLAGRQTDMLELHRELSLLQNMVRELPSLPASRRTAGDGYPARSAVAGQPKDLNSPPWEMMKEMQKQLSEKNIMLGRMVSEVDQSERERLTLEDQLEIIKRQVIETERRARQADADLQHLLEQQRGGGGSSYPVGGGSGDSSLAAVRRAELAESRQVELEGELADLSRQLDGLKSRQQEAQRRADDAARQCALLESRLDESERRMSESKRVTERAEQRAERAERGLRDLEMKIIDGDRKHQQSESQCVALERKVRDSEGRVLELERLVKEGSTRLMDAEARAKSLEARASDGDMAAMSASSRVTSSERRIQELEAEQADLTAKLRDSERQRSDQNTTLHSAEAAVKKVRAEFENELFAAQRQSDVRQQSLVRELADAKMAVERAQLARAATEDRISDLEAALRQQEQLLRGGHGPEALKTVKSSLEERIRSLEDALAVRERSIQQLQDSLLGTDAEYNNKIQSILIELQAKTSALVDAEHRFTELEALMHRILNARGHVAERKKAYR